MLLAINFYAIAYLAFSCGYWNQGHIQSATDEGAYILNLHNALLHNNTQP